MDKEQLDVMNSTVKSLAEILCNFRDQLITGGMSENLAEELTKDIYRNFMGKQRW